MILTLIGFEAGTQRADCWNCGRREQQAQVSSAGRWADGTTVSFTTLTCIDHVTGSDIPHVHVQQSQCGSFNCYKISFIICDMKLYVKVICTSNDYFVMLTIRSCFWWGL